jgi:NMD protein affecting ribosome stability and mRNA decay
MSCRFCGEEIDERTKLLGLCGDCEQKEEERFWEIKREA